MNGRGRFDTRGMAAVVMALGIITASWIAAGAARHFVDSRATITVTGSAKQPLRSDRVLWRGMYSAQSPQLAAAYTELATTRRTVLAYLATQGFADSAVTVSQVMTVPLNERMPNGMTTERIEAYRLVQTVELRSGDVARMGVFQVTPAGSTDVSDYGVNDTSSLEKDITAVVSATFELR